MLILSATTDILQAKLAGAIATNQVRMVASWRDITTTAFTPGRTVILTNGATAVAAVGAPAASAQRVIDFINFYNADTAPVTLTVQLDDSGTPYVLWVGSLGVGESLQYVDGIGWQRLTAAGLVALGATTASSITGGVQALSGAGAVNTTQLCTDFTSTGGAQALTLADGALGQFKTITHVVDGGSGVLTPATKVGFTTVTFTNAGDSVTLRFTAAGWAVVGLFGAVVA